MSSMKEYIPRLSELAMSPKVPMPLTLFYLSCGSSLAAFILLPISLLDLGVLSLFINPPMTVFTILYHSFVLFVSQRPRKPTYPTYYASVVLFAFVLELGWVIAFITTTVVCASLHESFYSVDSLVKRGLPVSRSTQHLQVFLTLVLCLLTGGMAIKGYLIAQAEGEPDSWRPEGLLNVEADDIEKVRHSKEFSPCSSFYAGP